MKKESEWMPDCQIARLPDCSLPLGLLSFLPVFSLQSPVPSWPQLVQDFQASSVLDQSQGRPPGPRPPAVSSLLGAKRGKRGAAIGLQLVNASSFSCLAPHRHALYQTGTVSGDLYRNAGTSNTAASLEYSTSMPMLKICCHRSGSTTKTRPPAFSAEAKRLDVNARLCTRGAVNGRTDVAVSTGGASLEP
jgi:hypothetical protein